MACPGAGAAGQGVRRDHARRPGRVDRHGRRARPRLITVYIVHARLAVHAPGKADDPARSRLPELDAVPVGVLVVQGERDPFGMPPDGPRRTVVTVPGTHALLSTTAVATAVSGWLAGTLAP